VQAPALERGGEVAGVVAGQDDVRGLLRDERAHLRHRHLVLGERLQQHGLQRLVGAVDLVDEQDHRFLGTDRLQQGRGARNRSEKNTLSCAPMRSTADSRSGASATTWPIFSRRIWV
jgi:hypothetical protein